MRATTLAVAIVALALPITAQAAPNTAKPAQSKNVTRQTITADLKKAGFTNIQVQPVAFIARATDKNGHPVLMAFRPHSFEAVTELGGSGTQNGTGSMSGSKAPGKNMNNNDTDNSAGNGTTSK